MNSTDTLIAFVADQSGSMHGLTQATIDGFNQFLREQKNQDGKAWLSLTLFEGNVMPRYVAWDVNDIPDMATTGDNTYRPGGSTALLDGVGVTIKDIETWLESNNWFKGQILFVIWTDGGENASHLYNLAQVNEMIDKKTADGWQFVFLGTGEAGWRATSTFSSIPAANRVSVSNSVHEYTGTYASLSEATTTYRRTKTFVTPSSTGSK